MEQIELPVIDDRLWGRESPDPGSSYVGIAHDYPRLPAQAGGPTVAVEFVLKQVGQLWAVYHGPIFVRSEGGSWTIAPRDDLLEDDAHRQYEINDAEQRTLRDLTSNRWDSNWGELPLPNGGDYVRAEPPIPPIPFYEVMVTQNPFPPYPEGPGAYKNAFTGDYDLFAVWPVSPRHELVRQSELNWKRSPLVSEDGGQPPEPPALTAGQPMFTTVDEKPLTVESRRVPGLYFEFIPMGPLLEYGKLESPEWGNPSQLVMEVASELNIVAAEAYNLAHRDDDQAADGDRRPFQPNVAFHSDEGGRPDISAIDVPVAVFFPSSLALDLNARDARTPFCVDEARKFLTMLARLAGSCYLPLQAGWMCGMISLADNEGNVTADIGDDAKPGLARLLARLLVKGTIDLLPVADEAEIARLLYTALRPILPNPGLLEYSPTGQDSKPSHPTDADLRYMVRLELEEMDGALSLKVPGQERATE